MAYSIRVKKKTDPYEVAVTDFNTLCTDTTTGALAGQLIGEFLAAAQLTAQDMLSVADDNSAGLYHMTRSLVQRWGSRAWLPEIAAKLPAKNTRCNILHLHMLGIHPQHRGSKLGLRMMAQTINNFARAYFFAPLIVGIQPYPLAHSGAGDAMYHLMSQEEVASSVHSHQHPTGYFTPQITAELLKLGMYYAQLGFQWANRKTEKIMWLMLPEGGRVYIQR